MCFRFNVCVGIMTDYTRGYQIGHYFGEQYDYPPDGGSTSDQYRREVAQTLTKVLDIKVREPEFVRRTEEIVQQDRRRREWNRTHTPRIWHNKCVVLGDIQMHCLFRTIKTDSL